MDNNSGALSSLSSSPPTRIPSNESEITPEWVSKILNVHITPGSFKLEGNAHEKAGFLSNMARITFKTTNSDNVTSLIVKLLPEESNQEAGEARQLVICDNFDQTEIHLYQTVMPELLKLVPELDQFICPFVYGQIQHRNKAKNIPYASVLILQDLKQLGYTMVKFHENFGLPSTSFAPHELQYFSKCLTFLAKLHATAAGFEFQQQKSFLELYPWFPTVLFPVGDPRLNGKVPVLHNWFTKGFPATLKFLSGHGRTSTEVLAKITKIAENADAIFQCILKAGQIHPSLLHGDLWIHNVLVTDFSSGQSVKIIDWQMFGYADQCLDVAVFISQALNMDRLSKREFLESARLYYSIYTAKCKELNVVVKRNWEEFERFVTTYGLAYAFAFQVMGVQGMETLPGHEPKLHSIFELFAEIGVIDFMLSLVDE